MRQVRKPRLGHQPLLLGRPRRPLSPLGGPALPADPAPGRAGPLGAHPRGPARRSGGTVLLAWTGRPGISGLPGLGPPSISPVPAPSGTLGTRPSFAPGADNPRPPKHPTFDLVADRGGSIHEGPLSLGGRDAILLSPPPSGGGTTPGGCPWATLILLAIQGCRPRHRALPPPPPQTGPPPPPRPPAVVPPASLPDVFGRVSAALSSRAVPRHRSPPTGRRRPQPKATGPVADMLQAHPPRAAADAVRGGSSDPVADYPVADAPSVPSPPQSTLPRRRQHGRASTEET